MSALNRGFYDELHKIAKAGFPFKSVISGSVGGGLIGAAGLGAASAFLSGVADDDEPTSRAKMTRGLKAGALLGSVLGGIGAYRTVKAKRRLGSWLKRKLRLKLSK